MSGGHTAAVVALGVLLTLTVAAGNVVFAAQGSVLSQDFVTEAMAEEEGYDALTREMQRSVANATSNATGGDLGGDSFSSLVEGDPIQDAVTSEYVEAQVEPNVAAFYTYLHGDSEALNLTLDARPLAGNAGENVAASIRNATVTELVEAAPGDPFADVPVDAAFVERLNEGPDAYRAAKQDLRERVHERVLDAYVNRSFADAVAAEEYDRLLAPVVPNYDPDEYTEREKARMVDEREREVRAALRTDVESEHGDEIDATVEDRLDAYREDVAADRPSADRYGNEAIATAAGDLEVAAATTDRSYERYRENATGARADLAVAIGDYVTERITREAGVVDLNERLEIPKRGEFETARTAVGYADLAVIVLPLLALALLGGVWFASGSIAVTAATAGASLLVGALPALVGAQVVGHRLRSMLEIQGEAAASLEPVVVGIVDRVVAAVTGQSLLLAILGVVLIGVALALRYDLDERLGEIRRRP